MVGKGPVRVSLAAAPAAASAGAGAAAAAAVTFCGEVAGSVPPAHPILLRGRPACGFPRSGFVAPAAVLSRQAGDPSADSSEGVQLAKGGGLVHLPLDDAEGSAS